MVAKDAPYRVIVSSFLSMSFIEMLAGSCLNEDVILYGFSSRDFSNIF